jgi:putative tryptophan/tyrosine transport system substrate-binding protein
VRVSLYEDGMHRRRFIALLGGAIALPWAGAAQQKAMPVVGWLSLRSPADSTALMTGFRQGLAETGYVEGQNLTIEYRWAEGNRERLPALAADLVSSKGDRSRARPHRAALAAGDGRRGH